MGAQASMVDRMNEKESFRCKVVTFDEITKWTTDVARQVRDNQYHPTVVIGLTRGGWVPARLLCDYLQVKKLYAVKTEHWGITANQNGKALLTQELNASIENESVLIVDDITDTGESLMLALAHLEQMKPQNMKSATLLHINHSKIEPDFFSVKVKQENWTWFIFPWNLHEDLRTLLPKTLYEGKTEEEVQMAFKEQFHVDIADDLVRDTLQDLQRERKVTRKGRVWTKV